jgi:hypothetical protein
MRISISPTQTVDLEDPDNFRELGVIAQAAPDVEWLTSALSDFGRPEDIDHVYLNEGALPGLAGALGATADWQRGYGQMVEYARAHGWVNAAGEIRAHVEWSGA